MVIIKLMGGLGNQLQQYALYKKFVSMEVETKIDLSWFRSSNQETMFAKRSIELEYLDGVNYETATLEEVAQLIGRDNFWGKMKRKFAPTSYKKYVEDTIYDPELLKATDLYIEGYFACEFYYYDIIPSLRREIKFPIVKSARFMDIQSLVEDMADCDSVSLHMRRGDYLDSANQEVFGGICTSEYYGKAIRLCVERLDKPKFYVFSDDTDYAYEYVAGFMGMNPGVEMRVIDLNRGNDSLLDIYLMSKCKHNIVANSTFSFWGARFNDYEDPIKIRPTIHKNTQVFNRADMTRWWPGWIFVSPEGDIYE